MGGVELTPEMIKNGSYQELITSSLKQRIREMAFRMTMQL